VARCELLDGVNEGSALTWWTGYDKTGARIEDRSSKIDPKSERI
jgi:hypothetical protein